MRLTGEPASSHRESALYDPSGYHFGSVWPLFTGWAAVGEYRNHAAEAALANLRANAWLALDGAGGNTTEVLSGDSYSPLSTASPHQIWSAAMVVSPLLRGLLGLETDAAARRIVFAPHLPADWQTAGAHGIPLPGARVNLDIQRDAHTLQLTIANAGADAVHLEFAPAYPPCAHLDGAALDGQPIAWKTDSEYLDWHPRFEIIARHGKSTLTIRHHGLFGYALPFSPPQLAERSLNLKIVSEHWTDDGRQLVLTVSGRPSREYRLDLINGDLLASVAGATREGPAGLIVHIPAGPTDDYIDHQITFSLKPCGARSERGVLNRFGYSDSKEPLPRRSRAQHRQGAVAKTLSPSCRSATYWYTNAKVHCAKGRPMFGTRCGLVTIGVFAFAGSVSLVTSRGAAGRDQRSQSVRRQNKRDL